MLKKTSNTFNIGGGSFFYDLNFTSINLNTLLKNRMTQHCPFFHYEVVLFSSE